MVLKDLCQKGKGLIAVLGFIMYFVRFIFSNRGKKELVTKCRLLNQR